MAIVNNKEKWYDKNRNVFYWVGGRDDLCLWSTHAFGDRAPMTTALTHSFSSIKMFENCPSQYYHVRIAKTVQNKGGEATVWGERVHKQLEDTLKGAAELPPESAAYAPYIKAIERLAVPGLMQVETEATLNKELTPTGWWDNDAWLRSKLDVLVTRGKYAYVFDWKTGKRRPDWTQLELFALQVFAHYPEVVSVNSKFIWLKEGATDGKLFTRAEAPKMWENLLSRIHRIEQAQEANVWPARPSGLCPYCPARHLCPVAR